MTDIFKDKTEMILEKNAVSVAMDRSETQPGVPILSGERHWPDRNVENLIRPRRGHGY